VSGKAHHLCPNCHAASIAVRLSRYVNERCVGNFWSCEACGYEFETSVDFSEPAEGGSVYHIGSAVFRSHLI
jgi:predicted RNA-binding Zn-ribbon protein involved in translation (DUF1610 family)